MHSSFGPTFWGTFDGCCCELWVHFWWTSLNISRFNCCWFKVMVIRSRCIVHVAP
jgi:hypothetical protein